MIVFEASNLAQMAGVPDFFVDAVGYVQLQAGNVIITYCREIMSGGQKLLVPKVELVRPVAMIPLAIMRLQELAAVAEGKRPQCPQQRELAHNH